MTFEFTAEINDKIKLLEISIFKALSEGEADTPEGLTAIVAALTTVLTGLTCKLSEEEAKTKIQQFFDFTMEHCLEKRSEEAKDMEEFFSDFAIKPERTNH